MVTKEFFSRSVSLSTRSRNRTTVKASNHTPAPSQDDGPVRPCTDLSFPCFATHSPEVISDRLHVKQGPLSASSRPSSLDNFGSTSLAGHPPEPR